MKLVLGWSRDSKGKIANRHPVDVVNTITTLSGGGHTSEDGLGNTTPYVIDIYMVKVKTNVIGSLNIEPYNHMFEQCRRVYTKSGVCPTCCTQGGGGQDIKILDIYETTSICR